MDNIGITSKRTQALVNEFISIWNRLLALGAALVVEHVVRRPLFRTSTIGMLTVSLDWIIASALFAEGFKCD
jgi:hypothetical protein